MACISPSTPPHNLSFSSSSSSSRSLRHARRPSYPSYPPPSSLCRCRSTNPSDTNNSNNNDDNNSSSSSWRWEDVVKSAMKRLESYFNTNRDYSPAKRIENNNITATVSFDRDIAIEKKEEWDWDRWKKHFEDIDEQERIVSVLKLQLAQAVRRGDFEDAARLKVAIAAAAANDAVGRAMSQLNKAVAEERYHEAAFLRDNAGAGLVGWWSGLSENAHDPYGLIIRITAEHGRYVARSYSPRQLSTAAVGAPLFEIFFTMNKKGEYKQQAVYLKRKGLFHDPSMSTSNASGASSLLNPAGPTEDKGQLYIVSTEETGGGDDAEDIPDLGEGLPGFKGILQDMIPGVKVKVLKVTAPAKVDKDFITKVIEGIMDDEDDEKDIEFESTEAEDEGSSEGGNDRDELGNDADSGIIDNEEQNEISIKVVVEGVAQKLSGSAPAKDSIRVPAKLLKKGKSSFSFSIEKDVNQQDSKELASIDRKAKLQGQRSVDHVMFDLAKFIGREKIPLKVLKDVGELINLTLSQSRNRQPLDGSTTFHRIKISASPDPLNGLYIGAHGLYTSEVICLQRKYGQWQDERGAKEPLNLEFYEYVEAVKLTGDPYVPAGQVAFRAKVGKRYQLPHKGIIPEEFGVVARYKGQGRLAEPGFRNPRWVDGELVILDGKYIKGGPVVGFVYWAPEYHFLVFFNRLRLQ